MRSYVVRVIHRTGGAALSFADLDANPASALERNLGEDEVEDLIRMVKTGDSWDSSRIEAIGDALYRGLDGPERWLEPILADRSDVALLLDTDGALRGLPWGLLHATTFLCAQPHRLVTPVRRLSGAGKRTSPDACNRPLRVLFMASSPEAVQPVLDFEQEEARILEATKAQPIELIVEESGTLRGLEERLRDFGAEHFDVVHLSGHAGRVNGRPCFFFEDNRGGSDPVFADKLARAFETAWPRLLFLSGCSTGQAFEQGDLPSLCEALVADATPLGALVTPKKTPGRAKRHIREARSELIEAGSHVEVCHRSAFVGRRRSIQRCLRVLLSREGDEGHAEGVLLHGLGGLGKSSLAARLCDRMPEHRRVVCVGRLDEIQLLRALSERYPAAIGLLNSDLPLKARLRSALEEPLYQAPALFIFDDFEHNLDRTNVGAGLRPEALDVLKSLVQAIREVCSDSRVIVTSRFAFALELDPKRQPFLVHEALESMRGADLRKKLAQLEHLGDDTQEKAVVRARAITLAAGNPRLLERLDKVLAAQEDKVLPILLAMGDTVEEFREAIFLDGLLKQQTSACRRMLALLSVVNLPSGTVESRFLVPGIVRPALAGETSEEEQQNACGRAADWLYSAWVESEGDTAEERAIEVHRLACAGKNKKVAGTLGSALAHSWLECSRFREVVELCRATLQLGDNYRVLHTLAKATDVLGETGLAVSYCEKALVQCRADVASVLNSSALDEQGAIANSLAMILRRCGQLERALELWGEALDVAIKIDSPRAKAAVISHVAGVVNARNDFDKAFEMWHKSIALSEHIGDVKGKSATLIYVVAALYERGRLGEALKLVDEGLELCEEGENRRYKAAILNSKAAILMSQGEVTSAAELWDEALKIQQDIGDAEGEAQTLYNMAYVPAERGEFDKALELWGKASGLKGKIGDVRGQAKAIRNMALYDRSGKALELLSVRVRVRDESRCKQVNDVHQAKVPQDRTVQVPGARYPSRLQRHLQRPPRPERHWQDDAARPHHPDRHG